MGHRIRGLLLVTLLASGAAARTPGPAIDGLWSLTADGGGQILALIERDDGRILGYNCASPGGWITGGQRTGPAVTLTSDNRDPHTASDPGSFSGTRSGATIPGTITDGGGTAAVTLHHVGARRTVEHWILAPASGPGGLVKAMRAAKPSGDFAAGGFIAQTDCDFLACGGAITSWTVSGASHSITTASGGACTSASTLTGTFDPTTKFLNGSFTTTATCLPAPIAGTFAGGTEGQTDSDDILDTLRLLRDFADRIEAESPTAAHAFADTYLNDGKTKADWRAQLTAMYAAYTGLHVTIDAVRQIVTVNDADTNPAVLLPPRIVWHLQVTGTPTGGGPVTTVLDLSSALTGDQQLFWIGRRGGRMVFVGNGYAAPFSIDLPIAAADIARNAFGLWPMFVHGGGHPEGHPGWDFDYVAGANILAAADGTVVSLEPNPAWPGQSNISIRHRPGFETQCDHVSVVAPGIAVGAAVTRGQALGTASFFGPQTMCHFALHQGTDVVSPIPFLSPAGLALFNTIWSTAAYGEELTEPYPVNTPTVTFPLPRVWTRTSGGLAGVVEFIRQNAATLDYRYVFRDFAGGPAVESGDLLFINPLESPGSGTFDLRPDGSPLPTRFARYSILSGSMQLDYAAIRPANLASASVYSTP